jgi:hypothetical protein
MRPEHALLVVCHLQRMQHDSAAQQPAELFAACCLAIAGSFQVAPYCDIASLPELWQQVAILETAPQTVPAFLLSWDAPQCPQRSQLQVSCQHLCCTPHPYLIAGPWLHPDLPAGFQCALQRHLH